MTGNTGSTAETTHGADAVNIAIASGKGGTGKTTLAVNLAAAAARRGRSVAYLDADVEEPNGHLFLHPEIDQREPVSLLVPQVHEEACNECGLCGQSCQYSAIVCLGAKPLVFPELCHGCGGCALACPRRAIIEVPYPIGRVETGRAKGVAFVQGVLDVGQAKSPPVIRAVKAAAPSVDWQIIDAPPGTACPVVTAVRGADLVLLVTEPTPFGLHDLRLAVETVRRLGPAAAVVINRAGIGDDRVARYCREEGLGVWAEIPDDRRIAEAYARGRMVGEAVPEFGRVMESLLERLEAWSSRECGG